MKFIYKNFLLLIIFVGFIIRLLPFNFPFFNIEETRIAYRGFVISQIGKDELGRSFPLLFNSLNDYQLPLVSYITAFGEFLFGKGDFGARIPFILIGTLLILLVYQIAKFFSPKSYIWILSSTLIAFSPPLIFLSKIPNDTILLVFIICLLFYLIVNNKNLIFIILSFIAGILTSKFAWFILLPFIFFSLFIFQANFYKRERLLLMIASIIIISTFTLFLTVPQSKRSFSENNFSIFTNITIKNGIDTLRGQGTKSNWPYFIDRLLFNKSIFFPVGFLHWMSQLSPATFFGQFDENGKMSFTSMGAWPKVLIFPLILGLFFIAREKEKKAKLILPFFLITTFPAFFIYPDKSLSVVALTLPFMAIIISLGLNQLPKKILGVILLLAILETLANIFYLAPEIKKTNNLRPIWIEEIIKDIPTGEKSNKVGISDTIVSDIVPFIEWYTDFNPKDGFVNVESPYRFIQYDLGNIKIINSNDTFTTCEEGKQKVFVGERDLDKIGKENATSISRIYKDNTDKEVAYLISNICTR